MLSPVKLVNSLENEQSKRCYISCSLHLKHHWRFEKIKSWTSCLLISLVENVLFWWTSSVSDHSVLFLRLVGVGPAVLLLALRDVPGDLVSLRSDIDWKQKCILWLNTRTFYSFQFLLGKFETEYHMTFTWMVWPKRRTAPFFEGDIKLTRDETLASGRTRLLLGSWETRPFNVLTSAHLYPAGGVTRPRITIPFFNRRPSVWFKL